MAHTSESLRDAFKYLFRGEVGRDYILIEQDEASVATAEGRIAAWHEENQARQLPLDT